MSSLRIKVEFQGIKFYFSVEKGDATFDSIKPSLAEHINKQGKNISANCFECCDSEGYSFIGSDIVSKLVK